MWVSPLLVLVMALMMRLINSAIVYGAVSLCRVPAPIDHVPVSIASDALRQMSFKAIARQQHPKVPLRILSHYCVRVWILARNGRSDALAPIITQLPKMMIGKNGMNGSYFMI